MKIPHELDAAGTEMVLADGLATPFFLLDLDGICRSAASYRSTWLTHFPEAGFAWSYKTNPLSEVTRSLLGLGYDAEVVTSSEWCWALEDGYLPAGITVNGPVKPTGLLADALATGATIHLDSFEELERILAMPRMDHPQIGLRLAHRLETGRLSRFGMSGEEADAAIARLQEEGIRLASLHLHTPAHAAPHGRLDAICAHQSLMRTAFQTDPNIIINLGGGDAPPPPGHSIAPSLSDDVAQLARLLTATGLEPARLRLRLEPGRALVEQHGALVARITGHKRRDGEVVMHCDARSELLRPRGAWNRPAVLCDPDFASVAVGHPPQTAKLYGTHCYESDLISNLDMPTDIQVGCPVILGAAGAYDLSSAGIWGGPRPKVFTLRSGKYTEAKWRLHPAVGTHPVRDCISAKDDLFNGPHRHEMPFEFSADVAHVFDNMISRSVPFYSEIQDLMARLALRWAGSNPIVDLGCSTGTTLARIVALSRQRCRLIGIDSSAPMIERAEAKLAPFAGAHEIRLLCGDIQSLDLTGDEAPGTVLLSLVVQFMRPLERLTEIKRVHSALRPGGALLMLEKTIDPASDVASAFIEGYHSQKSQHGYSDREIRKKREALENRLIPFHPEENIRMLHTAGFARVSVFFTWLNFQGYLAIKQE